MRQINTIGLAWRGDPQRGIGPPGAEFPVMFQFIVAINEFSGGELNEVRIYLIEAGDFEEKLAHRGIPRIAPSDVAQEILTRLQVLSEPRARRSIYRATSVSSGPEFVEIDAIMPSLRVVDGPHGVTQPVFQD